MLPLLIFKGTHQSLKDNQNAKSVVSGIIDGTGTVGAATGPLVVGIVSDKLVRGCNCTELSSLDFLYFYTFFNFWLCRVGMCYFTFSCWLASYRLW